MAIRRLPLTIVLASRVLVNAAPVSLEAGLDTGVNKRSVRVKTPAISLNLNLGLSGDGTFFTPNVGACGWNNNKDDAIVALSKELYGNGNEKSKQCGRWVKIKGPKGTVKAKVADMCVGCAKYDVDMTISVFEKVADPNQGRVPIYWAFTQ